MKEKVTKRFKRIGSMCLALLMSATLIAGCGQSNTNTNATPSSSATPSATPSSTGTPEPEVIEGGFTRGITLDSPGTVNIFAFAEGQNYQKVLDKFHEITKDSLKTTVNFQWATKIKDEQPLKLAEKGDIDLIFDAAWVNMASNVSQGMYQDLSKYFNNPDYPGLQKAFPAEVIEAMRNPSDGAIYGVPFFSEYNNLATIFIRGDWREELGCQPVVDEATLEAYLKAVDENKARLGATSAAGLGDRAWYYFRNDTYTNQAGNIFEIAGTGARITQYAYALLNDAQNEVVDIMYIGDPGSEHPQFPNGNFMNTKTIEFSQRWARYINEDAVSISGQDVLDKFKAGLYGAIEKELGAYSDTLSGLQKYDPDARLEFYFYDKELGNKETAYMNQFIANNYMFVPYFNDDPDRAMAVLDWNFQCQANNDLFSRGLEGEDWEAVGEKGYRELYPDNKYTFPSWLWSVSAAYSRTDADLPAEVAEYFAYAKDSAKFKTSPIAGFSFNTKPVELEYTAFTTAQQNYYPLFMNGLFGSETEEKLNEFYESTKEYSSAIKDELKKQLNEYFKNK